MTIASEITRLQNDKAAMCAAIENKGVTVGNVTFDDYASCIDAIQTGGGVFGFNYLVVGGGASGEALSCNNGGGGGGQVFCGRDFFTSDYITIDVGCGGKGGISNYPSYGGGDTVMCYGDICVHSHGGCCASCQTGGSSGSGCGGGGGSLSCAGGGGGGACGAGGAYSGTKGGSGGLGITYCGMDFGGGGGGGSLSGGSCAGNGCCGGGAGNSDATGCGGGGGGSNSWVGGYGGNGGGGVVLISYPTDGSWGVSCGCGGCVSQCGDYTIHCFTTDGEFFPFDTSSCKHFSYLGVGGGGGGRCISTIRLNGGGGGGEVRLGTYTVLCNEIPITIGAGGNFATDGGDTHIGYITIRGGKGTGTNIGGSSGSSYKGGISSNCSSGGGGGAGGQGCRAVTTSGGRGGDGICGYGGGGGGGCGGAGVDGGGNYGSNANNYGGGGGGRGKGYQGLVDICYLTDGSCGFTCATGGDSCYTCDGYCVHRFTSDGTFTIVS